MGILNGDIPLVQLRYQDDGLPSDTSMEQRRVEDSILKCFVPYAPNNIRRESLESVQLHRNMHISYLRRGLKGLSRYMVALDASKPWLLYWIIHSLDLLGSSLSPAEIERAIETVILWQHKEGGFAGGPDQLAHLATTYAAVNSLAILGTEQAYNVINRDSLYAFLMRMKQPDGSFTMHDGGEIDIRGTYCALSVAALTNLLTPELTNNCAEFIQRSQSYEGGIGPAPSKEAHNGYTFCALAAMKILDGMHLLNMDKLIKWCAGRQMALEGGFQGRTNKLVDGCYSFWGAGDFPIIEAELGSEMKELGYLFDREALQEYILLCCQSETGGLIDKPGKGTDYYHTCYCLSGLSTAQHFFHFDGAKAKAIESKLKADNGREVDARRGGLGSLMWYYTNEFVILGDIENHLLPTHPIHNISLPKTRSMIRHFYKNELQDVLDLLPKDEDPCEEAV
ncbi:terpenoid cyclases/protein prenyltransferase alpha-alpha toroid [Radiomyces spectabilis]|uniref:terpenoid cyclases/protein prenyltransferase alpha-alpha toroid n=1 Tax=Radiomyces spectabilis TaxID=64574 RepID=UPI002220567E|nr:terpenoid cyclases/protein prenyltransferase alpha-alpha toroid [Radiomyces spectabilis]KAI8373007.1 terpenoid cyclases/protein prenyltransferase alpha-alpha toroid [Radiomyces spectabilis]